MVDGVINIPLPGRSLSCPADPSGVAPPCHFLVGPENRLVETAVRSVVDRRLHGLNPLVFYGPSGTGKSHLAEGLATTWRMRYRRQKIIYTTAVDFARDLSDAIETQAIEEFRARHRTAGLFVLEDLGMLTEGKSGKLNVQEELIATLDALVAEDRLMVVTTSAAPNALPGIVPALQSRLMAGLTIPLASPGVETRRAILRQLAAIRDITLSESAVRVLAAGLCGTAPELAGSLLQFTEPLRLSKNTDASQKKLRLDAAAAKKFLAWRDHTSQPSLHEIALATAKHFSLRIADVRSCARKRALVAARGVAVYLARRLTNESLDNIGHYFGGRDHTTVLHSCRKTEELMADDPVIAEAIIQLEKRLTKKKKC